MRIGLLGAVILAACGGGGGSGDDVTVPDAMGGGVVADPGASAIPFSWPDTEPNDDPVQAVALGTSTSAGEATWFDGTAASGSLGGGDLEDYFVFKSFAQGGNFHAAPCWDGTAAPNLMDFYVYKVVDSHVDSMVASSEDTDPACENLTGGADVAMDPSTVYLFELRVVDDPGVNVIYGA